MKVKWVTIQYQRIPWESAAHSDVALLVTTDMPEHCAFHVAESAIQPDKPQAEYLAKHLESVGRLVDLLLAANGGVLDWRRFRESIPDQGGSVVISRTFEADADNFADFVQLLRRELDRPVVAV